MKTCTACLQFGKESQKEKKSIKIETAKFFKQVKSDFHVWHTKQKHKIVMRKKIRKMDASKLRQKKKLKYRIKENFRFKDNLTV